MEEIPLKPSLDRQNLKKQVFVVFHCPVCQSFLKRWYGVRTDGSLTGLYIIKDRDFEREWAERFKTDVIREQKPTTYEPFVGDYTKLACKDPASVVVRKRMMRGINRHQSAMS